jgi:P-type E1-E2 ATPase
MKKFKFFSYDKILLIIFIIILSGHYSNITPRSWDDLFLVFFASVGTLPVILSALKALKNKKVSIDLLASVALVFALLGKEWESAVFINLMLTSARIFASYTSDKARSAIKSLLKLRPEKVKVQQEQAIVEKSLSQIKIGDLIVIELGDRIPVDGVVVSGQATVDQSSLTRESMPVNKDVKSRVFSSTLNVSGSMVVRAEKVGKDTTFEKIIKLVEDSEKNKVKIQGIADRFTTIYIVFTISGALILYFFTQNLSIVLSVLLVTCADDIAVAVPMAFSAAIGAAARRGIIIKGGDFLEGLAKISTIVFDKTGTITKGN